MENTLRGFPHPDTHLPTLTTCLGLGHHEFEILPPDPPLNPNTFFFRGLYLIIGSCLILQIFADGTMWLY